MARNSEKTGWESGIEVDDVQLWLEGWRPLWVFGPLTLGGRRSRNSTTWLLHFPAGTQHRVTSTKIQGREARVLLTISASTFGMREHTTNLIHGLVPNAPHRNHQPSDSVRQAKPGKSRGAADLWPPSEVRRAPPHVGCSIQARVGAFPIAGTRTAQLHLGW